MPSTNGRNMLYTAWGLEYKLTPAPPFAGSPCEPIPPVDVTPKWGDRLMAPTLVPCSGTMPEHQGTLPCPNSSHEPVYVSITRPLFHCKIGANCQPPTTRSRILLCGSSHLFLPKGKAYVPSMLKTQRVSKGAGP